MHGLDDRDQGAHGRIVDLDARWGGSKSNESIFTDHSGQSDFPTEGKDVLTPWVLATKSASSLCSFSVFECDASSRIAQHLNLFVGRGFTVSQYYWYI